VLCYNMLKDNVSLQVSLLLEVGFDSITCFFAYNSLLFCKANIKEWSNLQHVLDIYEQASGQRLNKEKTSIFFSRNTKDDIKRQILLDVGVHATNCFEKYLGLPTMVGRSRRMVFMSIKERHDATVLWGHNEQDSKIHWIKWEKIGIS
jgi:hypothetical protein